MNQTASLSDRATAAVIFVVSAGVALVGDAGHVASGTTEYLWDGVPVIWRSAIWFPLAVGSALLGVAWIGRRAGLPSARERTRADAVIGVALVLALYVLTSALKGTETTVSVALCGAFAAAVWAWWDPSRGAFAIAAAAAVLGPLAEIAVVALGAARYTPGSDGLINVGPWLPCLYFAAGAVASGMWRAIQGGADQSTASATSMPR